MSKGKSEAELVELFSTFCFKFRAPVESVHVLFQQAEAMNMLLHCPFQQERPREQQFLFLRDCKIQRLLGELHFCGWLFGHFFCSQLCEFGMESATEIGSGAPGYS